MGYLSKPVDDLDLVDRVYRGRQAPMDAEYLIVDDHAEREKIEHVCKVVPDIGIAVLTCAFRVKAVGLSNTSRFVIASN